MWASEGMPMMPMKHKILHGLVACRSKKKNVAQKRTLRATNLRSLPAACCRTTDMFGFFSTVRTIPFQCYVIYYLLGSIKLVVHIELTLHIKLAWDILLACHKCIGLGEQGLFVPQPALDDWILLWCCLVVAKQRSTNTKSNHSRWLWFVHKRFRWSKCFVSRKDFVPFFEYRKNIIIIMDKASETGVYLLYVEQATCYDQRRLDQGILWLDQWYKHHWLDQFLGLIDDDTQCLLWSWEVICSSMCM